jgi:hypothetical protein
MTAELVTPPSQNARLAVETSITLIVVELDGQSALAWEEIGIGECGGVSGFDLIGGAFGWAAGSLPTRNAGYAETHHRSTRP